MSAVVRLVAGAAMTPQPGTVAAFAQDAASRIAIADILKSLALGALIEPGDIEAAIRHITHDPSPRVVIVDLSGVHEPLAAIDRLAEVCMPGTRVVALGDINDIHLYRRLRLIGVAEYLVKPIAPDLLRAALTSPAPDQAAATETNATTASGGPTVVIGARGGVGATTVAVALAWLWAERKRRRTVLVDLDLAFGSASLALDVDPGHGLSEALANPDRIDGLLVSSATTKLGKHLYLLSSEQPLDGDRATKPDALERLVAGLRQSFQQIVFDLPRSDPALLRQGLEQAGTIIVVTDFSLAGVRDATRLIGLADKLAPGIKRMVVANRVGDGSKRGLTLAEVEKAIGVKLAGVIPEDNAGVPQALDAGKPLPAMNPASKATVALQALADAIDGVTPAPRGGFLTRFFPPDKRPMVKRPTDRPKERQP